MKYLGLALVSIFFLTGTINLSAQKDKTKQKKKVELKNMVDSVSYGIGVAVMKNLIDQGVTGINYDLVARGMSDLVDSTAKFTPEYSNQVVNDFLVKQYTLKFEKEKNVQLKYLEENRKKQGVIETKTGLQYKVITMGTGPVPKETNTVKVHYQGSLIDGKVFDSSYERGQPIDFPVTGVIQGWVEALLLMPQGSKWELYIPYQLGYGDKGAGGMIPPYATLIFLVELLEVK